MNIEKHYWTSFTKTKKTNLFFSLFKGGILGLFLFLSTGLFAQTTNWTGNVDDDWDNAGNWTDGVPDLTKTAQIFSSSTAELKIKTGTTATAKHIKHFSLDVNFIIEAGATLTVNGGGVIGAGIQIGIGVMVNEGEVNVDNFSASGFMVSFKGELINKGTINVNKNSTVGKRGMLVAGGGHFTNDIGSELYIYDVTLAGIVSGGSDAIFINKGKIDIHPSNYVTGKGFSVTEDIENDESGEIIVNNFSTGFSITQNSPFNNKGKITVGNIAPAITYGIEMRGPWSNEECGEIIVYGRFLKIRPLTNNGYLFLESNQPHTAFGITTNNGIINTVGSDFPGSLNNKEIIIEDSEVYNCPNSISSAFTRLFPLLYTFNGIYSDPGATISAGTYNQNTNIFTPTGGFSFGKNTYYVKLTDNSAGCVHIAKWVVNHEDTHPPTALCKSHTDDCATGSTYTLDPLDFDNGSFDLCSGIQGISVSPTTLSCASGAHNVTLTVTDNAGKTASCNTTVTLTATGPGDISIDDVTKLEGNWFGFTYYIFTVSRTPTTNLVSVQYSVSGGTATVLQDYLPASGTLYFPPSGGNTKNILVLVKKDNIAEPDETFHVNLSNAVGGSIVDPLGVGTILNDDGQTIIVNPNDDKNDVITQEFVTPEIELTVFPNPVRDIMNIQLDNLESDGLLKIMDLNGRIIWQSVAGEFNSAFEIPTFDWVKGTYILNLVNDKKVWTKRVIVQ